MLLIMLTYLCGLCVQLALSPPKLFDRYPAVNFQALITYMQVSY